MPHVIDIRHCAPDPVYSLGPDFSDVSPSGETLSFNNYFLERNGRPFIPVSGECHYSRLDPCRWEDALVKMRMGGINVVATYVFWNHVEAAEGEFDFTDRRDLRRFLRLCLKHGLYVILRVGPFCHGEVRNGGLPDWLYGKPFEVRTTDPAFLDHVRRLYSEIGKQVKGLCFREGGPVIGVQLDNEYMHASAPWEMTTGVTDEWVHPGHEGEAYILALRKIALASGLTPAFFTGTAWGGAAYSPRVLPLWGGYAYRPRLFYGGRREPHPATECYLYEDYHRDGAAFADDFAPAYPPSSRPYACCEMGGGMTCGYRYRFSLPFQSVDALANVKLGSGCNFIGYYMYHGGTNPLGRHGGYLNESQVPRLSYDYQAPLGEFGQLRPSYRRLKGLHQFLDSFGERLAPMETSLPAGAGEIDPSDTAGLRLAVRSDGVSGFLFVNNFQDHRAMPRRAGEGVRVQTLGGTYDFDLSIAPDENAILPFAFDMDGVPLRQANAQPLLRTVIGGRATYAFMVPEGMDGTFRFGEGVRLSGDAALPPGAWAHRFTASLGGRSVDVLVLDRETAGLAYRLRDGSLLFTDAAPLEDEAGGLRLETTSAENRLYTLPADLLAGRAERLGDEGCLGAYRVAAPAREIPVRATQTAPFRWTLALPEGALDGLRDARLQIDYRGDVGELFLGGTMISDNFCNGDTWEVGLLEHRDRLNAPMVLKLTPLREGSRVNVDSPMAARREQADALVAGLTSVRALAVHEIPLIDPPQAGFSQSRVEII